MQGNYFANEAGLLTYSSKFTDVRAKIHEHLEKLDAYKKCRCQCDEVDQPVNSMFGCR